MTPFHQVAAAVVLIVATARLTRLVCFDQYPPMAWFRNKWREITKDGEWARLVDCPYCAAPYLAAGLGAWGYWTDWQTAWWVFSSWLAVSYLSAVFVRYDGDDA